MKIDNSIKTVNGLQIPDTSAPTAKATGKAEASVSSDSVQLSSLVSAQNSGVFDASKVDAIKLAISNGSFEIDTGKVADGLINTVKDLLKPAVSQ